ncbi:MAG: hypothetical protein WD066_06965 [Planctomycetaceae bacterium]
MQQIRIFKGVETESGALEAEVNEWLAESDVRVERIFGNIAPQSPGATQSSGLSNSVFAPSDIMLVVLYETA